MLGEGRDATPAQAAVHWAALGLSHSCADKLEDLAQGRPLSAVPPPFAPPILRLVPHFPVPSP